MFILDGHQGYCYHWKVEFIPSVCVWYMRFSNLNELWRVNCVQRVKGCGKLQLTRWDFILIHRRTYWSKRRGEWWAHSRGKTQLERYKHKESRWMSEICLKTTTRRWEKNKIAKEERGSEPNKGRKINPEADLRLPESESDCSEERFTHTSLSRPQLWPPIPSFIGT